MQVDMLEPDAPAEATGSQPPALLPPPERAAVALNTKETEAKLRAAVEKHKGITEIKDKAGRDQAHGAAMELMRLRTGIGNKADEVRDDAKKFNAAVLAEEKRLVTIVESEEKRLKALRDAWDAAEKVRKEEEARIERARKEAIADRIAKIKGYRELAQQCRTSAMVQELIAKLTSLWKDYDVPELFQEFADDAGVAYRMTLEHMGITLKAKREAEVEAARLKAEREAEAERQRLERERLAAQQREQEEAAARLKAEREAFERERAAFLAQQQATEKAPEPVPPPAEPAAVESMVDLSEVAEVQPGIKIAECTDGDTLQSADIPMLPIDLSGTPAHSKVLINPQPGDVIELGTLPAGTVIGESEEEEAGVIAGFDEAINAPLTTKAENKVWASDEAPPAEHLVTVLAMHYGVPASTAIDWLVIRADDILNLDN